MFNTTEIPKRRFRTNVIVISTLIAAAVIVLTWQLGLGGQMSLLESQQRDPKSKQPGGASPSRLLRERPMQKAPELTGQGDDAKRATLFFIDWAGKSDMQQREEARRAMASARDNKDVVAAFCQEAFDAQKRDHSRALLVISIIGEMRSRFGEECLRRFVNLPFPTSGTKTAEGEIVEQTALARLQAKAIDGLAFLRTPSADQVVLQQVQKHPSKAVRAEAISAYLWNHRDSPEARNTLAKFVRKGEEIFLDRPRREEGEGARTFNPKLEAYLKKHPEVIPPRPQKIPEGKETPVRPIRVTRTKPRF
jgi:hypothetical protein